MDLHPFDLGELNQRAEGAASQYCVQRDGIDMSYNNTMVFPDMLPHAVYFKFHIVDGWLYAGYADAVRHLISLPVPLTEKLSLLLVHLFASGCHEYDTINLNCVDEMNPSLILSGENSTTFTLVRCER